MLFCLCPVTRSNVECRHDWDDDRCVGILSAIRASMTKQSRILIADLVINTTVGSDDRQYLIHLPEDYDEESPSPVVLSFHGVGSSPESLEAASQLSEPRQRLADKGIIAVYPQGLDGKGGGASWDGAPYAESDADDVSLRRMCILPCRLTSRPDRLRAHHPRRAFGQPVRRHESDIRFWILERRRLREFTRVSV